MRNFKIKGEVVNGNYNNFEIIDVDSGEVMTKDSRSVIISLEVKAIPIVTIEYFVTKLEFDLEIKEKERGV